MSPEDRARLIPGAAARRFEAKVRRGCEACGLDRARGPVLVGFSGGADSTALLLSLWALYAQRHALIALHVDHGLREGAAREAAHAGALCAARGIPFLKTDVSVSPDDPRGLEAAARAARRAAFARAAREAGSGAVALAHTREDQAETVLMRLFEGAGPRGLSGMAARAPLSSEEDEGAKENILIYRPLLKISRDEVRAYCKARGTQWVEDESNADEGRLRNRIRRRVLPAIVDALGESALTGLAASAANLAAGTAVVEAWATEAARRHVREADGGIRVEGLAALGELPQAVRAALWRSVLARTARGGTGRRALGRHLLALDRLALSENPSGALSLPGGVEAVREYDLLRLTGETQEPPPIAEEVSLPVPGSAFHAGLNLAFEAVETGEGVAPAGALAALVDAEAAGPALVIRTRRPGDRFYPPQGGGGKKLKDYLIDRKIPRRKRDRLALLARGEEIVWIVGHAVSEAFRARPLPGRRVLLSARPGSSPKVLN